MKDENQEIDIVVPWVDGSDPVWRASRNMYSEQNDGDNREERFRDWGTL